MPDNGVLVQLRGGHTSFLKGLEIDAVITRLFDAEQGGGIASFEQERDVYIYPEAVVSLIDFPERNA